MAENTAQAHAFTIGQGLDRQRNEGFAGGEGLRLCGVLSHRALWKLL